MPTEPRDPATATVKAELRTKMRAALQRMAPAQRQLDSLRACELLTRQTVWVNASAILFFVARPDEPDLLPLLEAALAAGKTVALPSYVPETGAYTACRIEQYPRDCAPGKFGIAEPSDACPIFPLNRLDFALVPGLAFDVSGHRLGRGQGYYDRLLAEATGTRCGVAFDEQIIETIPAEPHDMSVNCILTPTQWMDFPAAR